MSVRYLSRPEAAEYLAGRGTPFAKGTLAKLACIGGGPPHRRLGNRTFYLPEDLDAWIEAKMSAPRSSTSKAA